MYRLHFSVYEYVEGETACVPQSLFLSLLVCVCVCDSEAMWRTQKHSAIMFEN